MSEYRRDPYAVSRSATQAVFVIPLRRHEGSLEDNILRLEGVAGHIWQLLESPRSLASLVGELEAEYEVERSQLEADVLEFLARLVELQAVTKE